MAKELHKVGIVVEDNDLTLIMLNGLDPSYDPFVKTQSTLVDDISFTSFFGLLKDYDNCLQRPSDFKITTANVVQATRSEVIVFQIFTIRGHLALACYNRHN